MTFHVVPDWNAPIIDRARAHSVKKLNLQLAPLDSIIEFLGGHTSAVYYCRIVEFEGTKSLKIWYNPKAQCIAAPVSSIECSPPGDFFAMRPAYMHVGWGYLIPTFRYGEENGKRITTIDEPDCRADVYKEIIFQGPVR